MTELVFTTAKRRSDSIPFSLDGEDFLFTPPKRATAMLPVLDATGDEDLAASRAMFDWFLSGVDKRDRIHARLMDPLDDFDIEDLDPIVTALMEATAGRPTT